MHLVKLVAVFAISALAAPIEDSLESTSNTPARLGDSGEDLSIGTNDFLDSGDDGADNAMSLYSRGPENCYQTGTDWKPNNGQVLQLMNDVCLKDMRGKWKKNEKVSKCRGITSHTPFSPVKSMWLEIQNRGGPRDLSKEACSKMLRTMFDECGKGGEYTNKNGWFIKADPVARTC